MQRVTIGSGTTTWPCLTADDAAELRRRYNCRHSPLPSKPVRALTFQSYADGYTIGVAASTFPAHTLLFPAHNAARQLYADGYTIGIGSILFPP
jgi:hypothetical protein